VFLTEIEFFGDILRPVVRDFPPSRVFETSALGELAMASQLRVALIGGYGGGNFGNDASLAASIDGLEANLSGFRAFLRRSITDAAHEGDVHSDAADAIAPQ